MATVNNFEDLEIWQMAREICKKIHVYSQREGFRKDFSLIDQMKRSSGSIMDNIAEGFEREGKKEFIQYLYISKGSSGECRSQTYRALDRKYITEEEHKELYSMLKNESQKIRAFIQYLKQSGYKGQKYK